MINTLAIAPWEEDISTARWELRNVVCTCKMGLAIDGIELTIADIGRLEHVARPEGCTVTLVPSKAARHRLCSLFDMTGEEYDAMIEWFSGHFGFCNDCA